MNDPLNDVDFSETGLDAWWKLSSPDRRYDVGIFDINMPVINGITLLERVRTTPRLRDLPVILCSGLKDRHLVMQATQFGIYHYLAKPFSIDVLREKIADLGEKLPLRPQAAVLRPV